jgi:hypothetical protein
MTNLDKKIFLPILGIVAFLFIIAIASTVQNRMINSGGQKKFDEFKQARMEAQQKTEDSIRNVQDSLKLIETYKDSIQIIKKYVSEPNSAGGVDLNIIWKNKTKRVIKYALFQVAAINAVNDEVYSTISIYPVTEWVKVTGPVKPNQVNGYGTYWSCVWYNHTIKRCKIESVRLEFMDGSEIEFPI